MDVLAMIVAIAVHKSELKIFLETLLTF